MEAQRQTTRVFVAGIGSNTPDRQAQIDSAIKWLHATFSSVDISSVYETPELRGLHPDYLNAVAIGSTTLSQEAIECLFKERERIQGRTPQSKVTGKIPIDLDLVIFDDIVVRPRELEFRHFKIGYNQLTHSNESNQLTQN